MSPTLSSRELSKKYSMWHWIIPSIALIAALSFHATDAWVVGAVLVGLADTYLLVMLRIAAIKSADTTQPDRPPYFPRRVAALIVLPLVFGVQVAGFASLYKEFSNIHGYAGTLYASLINMGSFTYDDPGNTQMRRVLACQMISGILTLICAIPIVMSRLTNLDDAPPPKSEPPKFPQLTAFIGRRDVKILGFHWDENSKQIAVELDPESVDATMKANAADPKPDPQVTTLRPS